MNKVVASFGSSTGVRNLTMLAAPATPNARARLLPMMSIIKAPATHRSTCDCASDRDGTCSAAVGSWTVVTSTPMRPAAASLPRATRDAHRSESADGSGSAPGSTKPVARESVGGQRKPIQMSAAHSATPAAAIAISRLGHGRARATSTDVTISKTSASFVRCRTSSTTDAGETRRNVAPRRRAVECPRTRARTPALSIDAVLRSTARCR